MQRKNKTERVTSRRLALEEKKKLKPARVKTGELLWMVTAEQASVSGKQSQCGAAACSRSRISSQNGY